MSGFEELHDELRQVARQVLGAAAGRVDPGDPVVVERTVLADAGWLGLEVPESLGGAGATFAETAVVLEELGRAAAVSPFLGSAVLAVGALLAADPSARRDELLAAIAAGEVTATVALPTDDAAVACLAAGATARTEPARLPPTVAEDADRQASAQLPFAIAGGPSRRTVTGNAAFVPDASEADVVLLLAADADGTPVLVAPDSSTASPATTSSAVEAASPAGPATTSPHVGAASPVGGLVVTGTAVLDGRGFGTVAAERLVVADGDVLRLGPAGVGAVLRRAAVAVAVDSLGSATAMLEATVAYVEQRRQFDRAIGSFQAVKHQLADCLVQLTLARELVAAAVADIADPLAAARAKAHATSVAVDVVGTAMQLHGGIGYTWESGVHAHLKRVALNRSLFGSPAAHRRLLATAIRAARL